MDSLPKQNKLIPISQAAIVLGVSIDTVRRWDKSGVLHSERLDGKNRYFSLNELEVFKLSQPLSISKVAEKAGISSTTLRRLEARGLIKPKRNSAGERVYDEELLQKFLNSDYFLRKKQIKEEIIDNITPENKTEHLENEEPASQEPAIPYINLKPRPHSRINEFMTASTIIFLLLFTFSIRNIWASEFKNVKSLPTATSEVLSVTTPIEPEILSEPVQEATAEAEPKTTVTVKINDGSDYVNIRQKPTINSPKISQAKDSETFEFVSKNTDWFEVKLSDGSTGFISAKYAGGLN